MAFMENRTVRDLAAGAALGAALGTASLAASFLAGVKLLKRAYYVEWLAVAFMALYVLLAWLLYLRDDAFMKRRGEKKAAPENPGAASGEPSRSDASTRKARAVLSAAAAFLALASVILYFGFGVGATL